jgi:Flp pilus assembly protein TadG
MKRRNLQRRRGNVLVLTAFLMTAMIALLAFAIDLGYAYSARAELQRSADSAAIAATWELIDRNGKPGTENTSGLTTNARSIATQFAGLNHVCADVPALANSDVTVGYMADPSNPNESMVTPPTGKLPNAVQVRVQKTTDQNGAVPFFFAKALGYTQTSMQAQATAAFVSSFSGFQMPKDGSNLGILPYALDEQTWNSINTAGTDNWSYNSDSKSVSAGGDGVKEANLFPQGTGCPGNRGTVDIGGSNNSTADIARQITSGINASDMSAMGGSIQFGADGTLHLNGDTGISAGVKDELSSIVGKTRFIPIFRSVVGPGNNADYTIVKFVGVRVLAVDLTGSASSKYVMVQPANVIAKGAIYDPGAPATDYVYSPVWLVR